MLSLGNLWVKRKCYGHAKLGHLSHWHHWRSGVHPQLTWQSYFGHWDIKRFGIKLCEMWNSHSNVHEDKVLCDMTPCFLISSYRRLAGTCCRQLQYPSPGTPYYLDPEGGSNKFLQKIFKDLSIDMVSYPRKLVCSSVDLVFIMWPSCSLCLTNQWRIWSVTFCQSVPVPRCASVLCRTQAKWGS